MNLTGKKQKIVEQKMVIFLFNKVNVENLKNVIYFHLNNRCAHGITVIDTESEVNGPKFRFCLLRLLSHLRTAIFFFLF